MRLIAQVSTLLLLFFGALTVASPAVPTLPPSSLSAQAIGTASHTPLHRSKRFKTHTFYNPSRSHCLTLNVFASFLPLHTASSALIQLYTNLISDAASEVASIPISSLTASRGSIYVDFVASEGYNIPWGFVAEFAEKMLVVTERGFAGEFDGEYTHLASGAVIKVALRVAMAAAAA